MVSVGEGDDSIISNAMVRPQHPDLGRVTLRQLLATWVVHDLSHLRQVARVMAKQYREEVGPWECYLRVLQE